VRLLERVTVGDGWSCGTAAEIGVRFGRVPEWRWSLALVVDECRAEQLRLDEHLRERIVVIQQRDFEYASARRCSQIANR
jgi:hypothetical protein